MIHWFERKSIMTRQTEASSSIPTSMNAMWMVNSDSMESAMQVWSQWLDDWTRAQQESLQFLRDRMSRDFEATTRIAACKTPTEAFELQFRHTCDAVTDYVTETQKLATLVSRAAAGTFAPTASDARTMSHK
jgi:hypothetical protein